MIRDLTGLFLAVILVMAPGAVDAQIRPGGPPGQRAQRQELEQRVMEGLFRRVQEHLGLSREEMTTLQITMQSFREDRRALAMNQASLRHSLRNPAMEEISEEEAREILAEMVRVQEAELALYRKEQEELLNVLTPRQLVQFYRVRDEWGQRIQQLRQRRGPGGAGGGPPRFPPGPGGSVWPSGGSDSFETPEAWTQEAWMMSGWLPFH